MSLVIFFFIAVYKYNMILEEFVQRSSLFQYVLTWTKANLVIAFFCGDGDYLVFSPCYCNSLLIISSMSISLQVSRRAKKDRNCEGRAYWWRPEVFLMEKMEKRNNNKSLVHYTCFIPICCPGARVSFGVDLPH